MITRRRLTYAAGALLLWGVVAGAQEPSTAPAEDLRALDQEAERVLREVMDLGGEVLSAEDRQAHPGKNQVMMLVTMQPLAFFQLTTLEIKVDDKSVARHTYTPQEVEALRKGGAHSLFWGPLAAGRRQIVASFAGKLPKDPDYKGSVQHTLIAGVEPKTLQVELRLGDKKIFPEIFISEAR